MRRRIWSFFYKRVISGLRRSRPYIVGSVLWISFFNRLSTLTWYVFFENEALPLQLLHGTEINQIANCFFSDVHVVQ